MSFSIGFVNEYLESDCPLIISQLIEENTEYHSKLVKIQENGGFNDETETYNISEFFSQIHCSYTKDAIKECIPITLDFFLDNNINKKMQLDAYKEIKNGSYEYLKHINPEYISHKESCEAGNGIGGKSFSMINSSFCRFFEQETKNIMPNEIKDNIDTYGNSSCSKQHP